MERIKENQVFESFKKKEISNLSQVLGGETVSTGSSNSVHEHLSVVGDSWEVWYSDGNGNEIIP